MKKVVKSKEALEKLALESGASVAKSGGRPFNTGRKRAKPLPGLQKSLDSNPAPEPPPPPPPPSITEKSIVILGEKIDRAGDVNASILTELKQQISEIQFQQPDPPILDWDFEFVRDKNGYLTRIKAHAEIVQPLLN